MKFVLTEKIIILLLQYLGSKMEILFLEKWNMTTSFMFAYLHSTMNYTFIKRRGWTHHFSKWLIMLMNAFSTNDNAECT